MYKFMMSTMLAASIVASALGDDRVDALVEAMAEMQQRIAALEEENESLRQRVKALEACCEAGEMNLLDAEQGPVAQVLRIEVAPVNEQQLARAETLEERAKELVEQQREVEAQAVELLPRPVPMSVREESAIRRWERAEQNRVRHRREELRDRAALLAREARQLNAQAAALRRDAEQRRQIIHGWNGSDMVKLETLRDLSRQIQSIEARSFITWDGRLLAIVEDGLHYEIRRVDPVAKPADFTEYQR